MPVDSNIEDVRAQLSNTLHLFYTWYIAMIVLTRGTLAVPLFTH